MTLDVRAQQTIFCVKVVLSSGMDGQKGCDHFRNCAHYHLSIEGTLHPKLVVPKVLLCFMCGEKKGAATMLLCNKFQQGWHMACLTLSLISPSPMIGDLSLMSEICGTCYVFGQTLTTFEKQIHNWHDDNIAIFIDYAPDT